MQWLGFNRESNWRQAGKPPVLRRRTTDSVPRGGIPYHRWPRLLTSRQPGTIRINRGDFGKPGVTALPQPQPEENLALPRDADGKLADGAAVLRQDRHGLANINLRDLAIYRIPPPRTTTRATPWCIYPMCTFAHPIEDALEQIHPQHRHAGFRRPAPVLTDSLLGVCAKAACSCPPPRQAPNLRASNLTHVITSKRKLAHSKRKKISWDGRPRITSSSACAAAATRRGDLGRVGEAGQGSVRHWRMCAAITGDADAAHVIEPAQCPNQRGATDHDRAGRN